MVPKEAEEGSGSIASISPLAVSEKRCFPDGNSQACRFSLSAVNRTVPEEFIARRFNSAGIGTRVIRVLLATLQTSIKKSLGGFLVSKATSFPSAAGRTRVDAELARDAVGCWSGSVYILVMPLSWIANILPDASIRFSPEISGKRVTSALSTEMRYSLLLHCAITSFGFRKYS